MTRVLIAGVTAALFMGIVPPAIANFHGGGGGFHGGGAGVFHGGERFHEGFRRERFHDHDHDHFRGPVIVGGLGLGAVGGALLAPSVPYGPPPVCYPTASGLSSATGWILLWTRRAAVCAIRRA